MSENNEWWRSAPFIRFIRKVFATQQVRAQEISEVLSVSWITSVIWVLMQFGSLLSMYRRR